MSVDSRLDRTALQELLENAFAVQESQVDSRFLSAFLGVQRLVAGGELDLNGVMNLIVDSARDVAGAAGVAIGVLEKDQLIYRAGSGCSVVRIENRVAVSLTVSEKTQASREILRVENARTDTRIEGAVCRQFGAESLLILPLCRAHTLAGVLEIAFSEVHAYQDCEVRMYRLMAGLIEEAMCRAVQAEPSPATESQAVRNAFQEAPNSEGHLTADRSFDYRRIFSYLQQNDVYLRCKAAWAVIRQQVRISSANGIEICSRGIKNCSRALRRSGSLAQILVQRAADVIASRPLRSLALSAVIAGLGLVFWLTHSDHGRASHGESSPSESAAVKSFQSGVPPIAKTSKTRSAPIAVNKSKERVQRARLGQSGQTEVDYIGDDVTVRHFSYKTPRQRPASRVAYVGGDVTVRYFTPKSAVRSESR